VDREAGADDSGGACATGPGVGCASPRRGLRRHEGPQCDDPAVAELAGGRAVACAAVEMDGLRVLAARPHRNKLRVGHLHGNRFEVVLSEIVTGESDSLRAQLLHIAGHGLPNRYGRQRFGGAGDNAQVGIEILRGKPARAGCRRRKLLLSAVQSAVFNRALELRASSGGLTLVRLGDILQKTETGGSFVCEEPERDQARVDAGELVPTAPLPGSRTMEPPAGTPARALEEQALADLGLAPAEFAKPAAICPARAGR